MACLDMYNHKGHHSPPPRISFSNDFVDSQQMIKQERSSSSPPTAASSDFEFSVSGYSMVSADELFCKGRFMPFKDQMPRTLRDELLLLDEDDDNEEDQVSLSPLKGWKGLLGLRRTHIKKVGKTITTQVVSVDDETASPGNFVHRQDQMCLAKSSQEVLSEGGSSCRDVEMGI